MRYNTFKATIFVSMGILAAANGALHRAHLRNAGVIPLALFPLLLGAAFALASAPTTATAPARVPCTPISDGKYQCTWYVPGDGITGGASVVYNGAVVGYLHEGTNWISCQQQGGEVQNAAGDLNLWYGWTQSDGGKWGWASALEAQGGDNYGAFDGVPNCNGAHGSPPTANGLWPPSGATSPPAMSKQQPEPEINPWWQDIAAHAFGDAFNFNLHQRKIIDTDARNSDDGIIVLRFFIPSYIAAFGLLRGDNRDYSSEPNASSRAVLAWNTETGQVSFAVYGSAFLTGQSVAALPLNTVGREEVWVQSDQARSDNLVWLSGVPDRVDARISVLNSVSNDNSATAWSADNDLTIFRRAQGGYQLQINGNGYPQVELLYYPHYGPQTAHLHARRNIQHFYRYFPEPSGGFAARDEFSWSDCTQPNDHQLDCHSLRSPPSEHYLPPETLDWTTTW